MSVTIPSLDPVTDILDTDKIMVTQSSGQTYTIDGASFNKRNQAVIANSTTLTGAPLKTGNIVRAYFTADITGVNTSTGLVLNYNSSNKNVKVPKDGALVNFTAQNLGGTPTVYKYLQAYTTLELLYDGTNFVIIGNPVVISSADYTIYADGSKEETKSVRNVLFTEETHFGTAYVRAFGKLIQITMNGSTSNGIPPNTVILSGLPIPSIPRYFPVFKYNTQEIIGLIYINNDGQLIAYSGNTRNLQISVYSIEYIAS